MNSKYFKTKLDRTILENWTLRISIIALSLCVVILAVFLSINMTKQRTIILPPRVTKQFWVSGNHVSLGYLSQMGYYLAQTLLNITPQNYKTQLDNFMVYVYPPDYNSLNIPLSSQLKSIAELDISQVFYPIGNASVRGDKIFIYGELIRFSDNTNIKKKKYVVIKFKIQNGRFYVKNVSMVHSINNIK